MNFSTNPVIRWITNARDFGFEYVLNRYYGLYGGEVVECEDTQQQARACVKVTALGLGTVHPDGSFDPSPVPRRALPSSIYAGLDHGVYFPPEVGDAVWVAFDFGDPSRPRYHGSFWRNRDPSRSPANSEVPNEFKVNAGPSTKRGIKTGYGHGVIFNDDEKEAHVAIWTGKQISPGADATRSNQITLSETSSAPTVKTIDSTVKAGIYCNTRGGLRIAMNDSDQNIFISGARVDPDGETANSIKIDDKTGNIKIKTKLQQVIEVDDATGAINIDNLAAGGVGVINIQAKAAVNVSAGGVLTLTGTGGIAQGSGAAPPVAAPGVAIETGAGAKIITFIGAITETALAFTQTAATVIINAATSFTVVSPLVSIGIPGATEISIMGGLITIGNPATARNLANDYLVDFVLNHEHATAALGPPSKPTLGPLSTIVTPGLPLPPITLVQYASQLKAT